MTRSLAPFPSLLLALTLVGCGDSPNDSGGEPVDDVPPPAAVLDGRVVDALTDASLGGVTVGVDGGSGVTSSSDGRFELDESDLSDAPFIRFALDGYSEELLARPSPDADGFPDVGTVRLVPDDLAGEGGLAGRITDPEGQPVVGATLRLLRGLFVTEGEAEVTTVTGADGDWLATGLPYGNYTLIVADPGRGSDLPDRAGVRRGHPRRTGRGAYPFPRHRRRLRHRRSFPRQGSSRKRPTCRRGCWMVRLPPSTTTRGRTPTAGARLFCESATSCWWAATSTASSRAATAR